METSCNARPRFNGVWWQRLPMELLAQIFMFLSDGERCSARRTCKQWKNAMNVPELWSNKKLVFRTKKNCNAAEKFVKTFGGALKHLTLQIGIERRPIRGNFDLVKLGVQKFIESIPPTMQLESLTYRNVEQACFFDLTPKRSDKIKMAKAFIKWLRGQNSLKKLHVWQINFVSHEEPHLLVKALTTTPNAQNTESPLLATITHLNLPYNYYFSSMESYHEFAEELAKFKALTCLSLGVCYMSDILLEKLMNGCPNLVYLMLTITDYGFDERIFASTEGYRAALKIRPTLRVSVNILEICGNPPGYFMHNDLHKFHHYLPPGMPLVSLGFETRSWPKIQPEMINMSNVLNHITQNFSLTILHLDLGERCPPEAMVDLVASSSGVNYLSIQTKQLGLTTLLQLAEAASPNQERIKIRLGGCELAKKAREKLSANHPSCSVTVDKSPFDLSATTLKFFQD